MYHAGFETDVDLTEDMVLDDKARVKIMQHEQQFRWVKMRAKTEAIGSSLPELTSSG